MENIKPDATLSIRGVSEELKWKFRLICYKQGLRMGATIAQLMAAYVAAHEAQQPKGE
jgi:hypothetical protein